MHYSMHRRLCKGCLNSMRQKRAMRYLHAPWKISAGSLSGQDVGRVHGEMHLHHHVLWLARPHFSHQQMSTPSAAYEVTLVAARWAAQR